MCINIYKKNCLNSAPWVNSYSDNLIEVLEMSQYSTKSLFICLLLFIAISSFHFFKQDFVSDCICSWSLLI